MTKEERYEFVETCSKAWKDACPEHVDCVYATLVREAHSLGRVADADSENNLNALADRIERACHAYAGAALALGWPGPVVDEPTDEEDSE